MLTDFVKKCHGEIIPDCKQMRDSQHKSCFINLIDCNILKLISVKLILSSCVLLIRLAGTTDSSASRYSAALIMQINVEHSDKA